MKNRTRKENNKYSTSQIKISRQTHSRVNTPTGTSTSILPPHSLNTSERLIINPNRQIALIKNGQAHKQKHVQNKELI